MSETIRVVIADDQELFCQSLKIVLNVNPDMEVVDTVSDGGAAVESVLKFRPDVVLMDIRMPVMDGVEATRVIKEKCPATRVIVLTTFADDEYVFGALKNGASGYLLKGAGIQELAEAIRVAHSGGAMVNPNIASKMIALFSNMAHGGPSLAVEDGRAASLTRGELPVVQAVGRGLSNKEIAAELCLSEGTVRNVISTVLGKLGLRDRTQLAIWAVETGLRSRGTP